MKVADNKIEFTRTATINNRNLELNSLNLYRWSGGFLDVFKTKRCLRCEPDRVFTNLSSQRKLVCQSEIVSANSK